MKQTRMGRPRTATSAREAWRHHRKAIVHRQKELAALLDVTQPAISKWHHVPENRLPVVAEFMGLQPSDLRPDLFDPWSALVSNRKD